MKSLSEHESVSVQLPTFDGVPVLQPATPTHQPAKAGVLTALPEHFLAGYANDEFENLCKEFDVSESFRPIDSTGLPYVPPSLGRGEDVDQLHVPFTYIQSFYPTKYSTQFS